MTQPLTVTRHQAEQGMACFPFHCTVALAKPRLHSRNRRALSPGSRIKATQQPGPEHVPGSLTAAVQDDSPVNP